MAAILTTPTVTVVEGATNPVIVEIQCTDDVPDLTGADVGVEVYTTTDGTLVLPSGGWTFTVTTAAATAGDVVVVEVSPPGSGYVLGGYTFTWGSASAPRSGFRARAFVTPSGASVAIPCWNAEIAVTPRSGRP